MPPGLRALTGQVTLKTPVAGERKSSRVGSLNLHLYGDLVDSQAETATEETFCESTHQAPTIQAVGACLTLPSWAPPAAAHVTTTDALNPSAAPCRHIASPDRTAALPLPSTPPGIAAEADAHCSSGATERPLLPLTCVTSLLWSDEVSEHSAVLGSCYEEELVQRLLSGWCPMVRFLSYGGTSSSSPQRLAPRSGARKPPESTDSGGFLFAIT